ncbi:hypothetical protein [Nocardia terpenica]|nr:hypothetical protein [Nocardia terpenica]
MPVRVGFSGAAAGEGDGGGDELDIPILLAPRALESELRYPDNRPPETIGLDSARLPLAAGGSLFTRTGRLLGASV